MPFTTTVTHDEVAVQLRGSVTICDVADLRRELLQCLEQSDQVVIDLEAVDGVDTATLQLLCAAHRSAERRGKRLLTRKRSVVVDAAILQIGLHAAPPFAA